MSLIFPFRQFLEEVEFQLAIVGPVIYIPIKLNVVHCVLEETCYLEHSL